MLFKVGPAARLDRNKANVPCRYHLSYHTPAQIIVGLILGFIVGGAYYYITEYVSRLPLRLPAPLGSPVVTQSSYSFGASTSTEFPPWTPTRSGEPRARGSARVEPQQEPETKANLRPRRTSSISSVLPKVDLHPAPPLRQMILDHPLAVAFRVRDSWTVWRDGGIEGEYGSWRREWERRREWTELSTPRSPVAATIDAQHHGEPTLKMPRATAPAIRVCGDEGDNLSPDEVARHFDLMLGALRQAKRCPPTQSAFCVGCVITSRATSQVLATGYSRELGDKDHAEQCAIAKLQVQTPGTRSGPPQELDLYTTMEPCSFRASDPLPCAQRILALANAHTQQQPQQYKVVRVFLGCYEPTDFVADCQGAQMLHDAGIEVRAVRALRPLVYRDANGKQVREPEWLKLECERVAKYGHPDPPGALPGVESMYT